MDERTDYVQKILAEWNAMNELFEICNRHQDLIAGYHFDIEEEG